MESYFPKTVHNFRMAYSLCLFSKDCLLVGNEIVNILDDMKMLKASSLNAQSFPVCDALR